MTRESLFLLKAPSVVVIRVSCNPRFLGRPFVRHLVAWMRTSTCCGTFGTILFGRDEVANSAGSVVISIKRNLIDVQ